MAAQEENLTLSIPTPKRIAPRLELWFSCGPTHTLEKTVFAHALVGAGRVAVRGKTIGCHTFQWSPAVHALALLLVRAVLDEERGAFLEGMVRTPASSLDYALSKHPLWLQDMFGSDSQGRSLTSRMFQRINPDRKRPGPVSIILNTKFLPASGISLYGDGQLIESRECVALLASALETSFHSTGRRSAPTVTAEPENKTQSAWYGASAAHLIEHKEREVSARLESSADNTEELIGCLTSLATGVPSNANFIDAGDYLTWLQTKLAEAERSGASASLAAFVKDQIKTFCINAEIYFTRKLASADRRHKMLYSCSSLVDHGIAKYLEDSGWQLLLMAMGESARESGREHTRIFFMQNETLSLEEFLGLRKIIAAHLANNTAVAITPIGTLKGDLKSHSNMALLGNRVMLSATDQVRWDLEFTDTQQRLKDAYDKHEIYQETAILTLRPAMLNRITNALAEVFTVEDCDVAV